MDLSLTKRMLYQLSYEGNCLQGQQGALTDVTSANARHASCRCCRW